MSSLVLNCYLFVKKVDKRDVSQPIQRPAFVRIGRADDLRHTAFVRIGRWRSDEDLADDNPERREDLLMEEPTMADDQPWSFDKRRVKDAFVRIGRSRSQGAAFVRIGRSRWLARQPPYFYDRLNPGVIGTHIARAIRAGSFVRIGKSDGY